MNRVAIIGAPACPTVRSPSRWAESGRAKQNHEVRTHPPVSLVRELAENGEGKIAESFDLDTQRDDRMRA
jgi:hypothetical protein